MQFAMVVRWCFNTGNINVKAKNCVQLQNESLLLKTASYYVVVLNYY